MADISSLGAPRQVEPIDLGGNYAPVKESSFQLATKGRYTLQARPQFEATAFGRTRGGDLKVAIDPTIVGPTNEGYQLRFTSVSAKTYQRSGMHVSQLGDYLLACGVTGKLSTEQEQADAAEQTAGRLFEAEIDWRGYNSKTGFEVQGMTKFPKRADGTYQSWIEDPNAFEVDDAGNQIVGKDGKPQHKRVPARLFIDKFYPAA